MPHCLLMYTSIHTGCCRVLRSLCCSVLQCAALCGSVLQCVAVLRRRTVFRCTHQYTQAHTHGCIVSIVLYYSACSSLCCSVLQCVAVCCSVVTVCCRLQAPHCASMYTINTHRHKRMVALCQLYCVAVRATVCVAVCCSVLQRCCSVSQT